MRCIAYLAPYLYGHDERLQTLIRNGLEPALAACFAEELKTDRPENNRAWRAYQRLVLEGLQDGIAAVQAGQATIAANVDSLAEAVRRIEAWSARLDALGAEIRERTGEVALDALIVQARDQVLSAVAGEAEATRDVVVQESEVTREAVIAVHDELRGLAQELRRARPVANADVLLRGPIRALGLQKDLYRADALDDRVAAAALYDQIALRLSEAGHSFHARLVRERRAMSLADGGAIEGAFVAWLDDAVNDLHAGTLWIPPHVKAGLDTHRDSVPPALAARADAVEGLEAWFEHPVAAVRAMRGALGVLRHSEDTWAPIVGCWLGEAIAVDERVDGLDLAVMLPDFEALAAAAAEPFAIRLRLLAAEVTGNWDDLPDEATTGALAPADAGLVLCRHGRWLALEAEPDAAIDEYRRAVGKLAEANLLGDAAGALRTIAKIRLRYADDPTTANEDLNLARLVAHEPRRFGHRGDARGVGLEALHGAHGGRQRRLPDALRSLRRYLWESRISGHLHAELDAQALLGDVYSLGGERGAAIRYYILAGEDKKAADLTESLPPVDVEVYLNRRAPWVVGSALAVIAGQGEGMSAESVESVAPRIIELTAGVRQSLSRPEVHVEAWKALAATALQLPDVFVDPVLDRLDPLIEREPNHYRRTDDSMLELLVRLHRFRPETQGRVSVAITRCLADSDLARRLIPYLRSAVGGDEVLKGAVIALADAGNPVGVQVLASAGMQHPAVVHEAHSLAESVLGHAVGVARDEVSVSNAFEQAAGLAGFLPQAKRDELAAHLLAIAQDTFSPEAYRSSAANALAIFAHHIGESVRSAAFEGALMLIGSGPSEHLLDALMRESLHPFSRFRSDLSGLSLRRSAMVAAGRLATTREQAERLLSALVRVLGSGGETPDMPAAFRAILAIDPAIRPPIDLEQLASHPLSVARAAATSLWADDPGAFPDLGRRLAVDPDQEVRRKLAGSLAKVAERAPERAEQLRAILSRDPSAAVRALAIRS